MIQYLFTSTKDNDSLFVNMTPLPNHARCHSHSELLDMGTPANKTKWRKSHDHPISESAKRLLIKRIQDRDFSHVLK